MTEQKQKPARPVLRRQGDYLMLQLPADVNVPTTGVVGNNIVSKSALTGHTHQFASPKVRLRAIEQSADLLAVVPAATKLVHEEHSSLPVTKGRVVVRRQVERSSDGIAPVQD